MSPTDARQINAALGQLVSDRVLQRRSRCSIPHCVEPATVTLVAQPSGVMKKEKEQTRFGFCGVHGDEYRTLGYSTETS